MIDLHAHVLPGLDHGARSWEEAVEMCRIAAADGIRTLAATPHVSELFRNAPEAIRAAAAELQRRLDAAGVRLRIVAGGDYHIRPDLGPANVVTLAENGRYFLLEFPYQVLPPHAEGFVDTLRGRGLVPVVTHPERTATLQRDPRRLEGFVRRGALVQITAGSLLGQFGSAAAAAAERFLKKGWVHLLASDAHWAHERPPLLADGCRAAARVVGEGEARRLVEGNPLAVLEGRELAPAPVKNFGKTKA